MSKYNKTLLPKTDLVQRRSSYYYAVNINSAIDAGILEQYLLQEMRKQSLNIDFEYAVYDCSTDKLVYGNYCSTENKDEKDIKKSKNLQKFNDLIYYFVVRFPKRESFLLANRNMTLTLTLLPVLAIAFFLYSMWVILEQKRLSELQKDFINNMTYEFKTPLATIKISSEVLKNPNIVNNPERLLNYATIISNETEHLTHQVERVLQMEKSGRDVISLFAKLLTLQNLFLDADER